MYKFEEQFRKECPQTIGETDQHFDLDNYRDWLEEKLQSIHTGYLPLCTRVEVIDDKGRAYTNYHCKSVEIQMQDEQRTLKIFVK